MEYVMVERVFAEPVSPAQLEEAMKTNAACWAMHRVRPVRSSLSRDGLRVICEYEAPDAESVRIANQRAGLAFERVWSATVIHARPGATQESPQ